MGGEKSGPGWGLTTWVLGTPGGLRWAEYGGGYADPEGCRTDFPPPPAPADVGPQHHSPPPPPRRPPPWSPAWQTVPCFLHAAEPGRAPRGCQGLDAGMSEAPALAPGPSCLHRPSWNPALLRALGPPAAPSLQLCAFGARVLQTCVRSQACQPVSAPACTGVVGSSVERVSPGGLWGGRVASPEDESLPASIPGLALC